MPDHSMIIGEVEVISVSDGSMSVIPSDFFPKVPTNNWIPYRSHLNAEGNIVLNIGSFVLRSEGKTIIVDTGLGQSNTGLDVVDCGLLLEGLRNINIDVEDVDEVVITHLHRDHVGWNLLHDGEGVHPVFPKARYRLPKLDWEMFTRKDGIAMFDYIREQVVPLESLGVLDLLEGECMITSELTVIPTPGHTPGHSSLSIVSQGKRGVIVGDAIHHPAQVQETDWSPRPDFDPELSRQTRRELMDAIERDGSIAVSGHFPIPGFGRLLRLKDRRYWEALK